MEMVEDGSKGVRERTAEEEDLFQRSLKKSKGAVVVDEHMDDEMMEKLDDGAREETKDILPDSAKPSLKGSGRKVISYKDKLLRLNGGEGNFESEEDDWKEIQRKEEEEDDCEEDLAQDPEEDPLCPALQFTKSEHKESCKQWRKALIIKLMGKRIGTRFLMARLQRLWNLVSTYELIDLDNGYLLLRFHDEVDYVHVLEEGPWIVADHYVVVQRWRPLFDPYDEGFRRMAVWIRVPGLPIEFYTVRYLWRVGNLFGRTLKVDRNSLRKNELGDAVITERAKFARICVEVDLRKSLLSKFKIGDKIYQVGYEGIHLICFHCGVYGHRKDQCGEVGSMNNKHQMEEESSGQTGMEEKSSDCAKEKCKVEEAFGSWMVVQRSIRKGRLRPVMLSKAKEKEEGPRADLSGSGVEKVATNMEIGEGSLGNLTEAITKEAQMKIDDPVVTEESKQAGLKAGESVEKGGSCGTLGPKIAPKNVKTDNSLQKKSILRENRGRGGSSGSKLGKGSLFDTKKGDVENLPLNAALGDADQGRKQRGRVKAMAAGGHGNSGEELVTQVKFRGKGVEAPVLLNSFAPLQEDSILDEQVTPLEGVKTSISH